MKITIATGIFIPEAGGPATYAPKIAQEFLAMGHRVNIVTYSDKGQYDFDSDLPYQVVRIKRGNKLVNYWRYYQVLNKVAKDSDIIYSFDHFSAGIPAAKFCWRHKKPLYIRVGGDFIWERYLDISKDLVTLKDFYEKNIHLNAEKLRFKLIKWVFGRATGIIFTTDWQKNIFKKFYNLPAKKLFVINNPIGKPNVDLDRSDIRKEIIFSGRFVHKNNLINLIKAFAEIKNRDYSLVFIGEGPIESEMKKAIDDLGADNISIEPRMSRESLMDRVAKAYFAIWPSLTDISPNSLLEALSMNVPVLSSSEIGFEELKDKIKTFDPRSASKMTEAISELLDEDNYNNYLRDIGDIAYDYTYKQAATDTIKIFENESHKH